MNLLKIIDGFKSKRILVVGDFFLDLYLIIDPALTEDSLETGLPAYQVTSRRLSPGAAGTVAKNLSHLGAEVFALGFTGDDGNGYDLRKELMRLGVNIENLIETPLRMTPTYTKPMLAYPDKPEEEMSRNDIKNFTITPECIQKRIIAALRDLAPTMDAILVLDQILEDDCGVVTSNVRDVLSELGESGACSVIYADSRANIHKFENVIVKCNHIEAARAIDGAADLHDCAKAVFDRTRRPVFITRGQDGMLVYSGNEFFDVAGVRVEGTVDICGAGDAASAGIVASLAAGAGLDEAAALGNISASIAIQQLGTTGHATPDQMRDIVTKL